MSRLRTRTRHDGVLLSRRLVLMLMRDLGSSRFSASILSFADLEPIPVRWSYHLVCSNLFLLGFDFPLIALEIYLFIKYLLQLNRDCMGAKHTNLLGGEGNKIAQHVDKSTEHS